MLRTAYRPLNDTTTKCFGVPLNFQNVTFFLSLLVQLGTLALSFASLAMGVDSQVLTLVLWLETIVQLVEGTWYSIVGCVFTVWKQSVPIYMRYVDWAVTTPIMLVTLLIFVIWSSDRCDTLGDIRAFPSFGGYVVLVVLMCWLMLLLGLLYEATWPAFTWLDVLQRVMRKGIDKSIGCGWGLWLGFIPLIVSFVPHTDAYFRGKSNSGLAAVVVTFVLWVLYGVNAMAAPDVATKNGIYNVLDIFSKNCAGVVVSIVSMNFNATEAGC